MENEVVWSVGFTNLAAYVDKTFNCIVDSLEEGEYQPADVVELACDADRLAVYCGQEAQELLIHYVREHGWQAVFKGLCSRVEAYQV